MALGAIIGGAVGLGSALLGFGSNKSNNKANQQLASQQNEYNQQLASQQNEYNLALQEREFAQNTEQSELEYQRNLEMWNLQNEYNSPEQQVGRYQAAGLNPNLIYGTGTASAGNASSSPSYSAARFTAPTAQRAEAQRAVHTPNFRSTIDPYQAISLTEQLGIQHAQKNQIAAQTDYIKQQTVNSAIDSLQKNFDLDFKKDTREYAMDKLYHTIQKLQADTSLSWSSTELNRQKELLSHTQRDILKQELSNLRTVGDLKQFELKLRKAGINDRDNIWVRLASRLILSHEDEITSFIDRFF